MANPKKNKAPGTGKTEPSNKDQQGVDKAPGEEQGKSEQVTKEDLKGKKIDADLSVKKDRPLNRGKD